MEQELLTQNGSDLASLKRLILRAACLWDFHFLVELIFSVSFSLQMWTLLIYFSIQNHAEMEDQGCSSSYEVFIVTLCIQKGYLHQTVLNG